MKKTDLIVVVGPTASGKTALAIDIAKRAGGEIVNADSMQIYKYMNIGTAKPSYEELMEIPHHLVDFLEPDEEFSVADYTNLAHKKIADIVSRGKTPVMAGGTGLYINSVVDDVNFGEIDTDYKIRKELEEMANKRGVQVLIDILREFDPESAERIHPNNVRRVVRAIEFYKVTGMTISEHQRITRLKESRYNPKMLGIKWDREVLYERINKRVDDMMEAGLLDEVKSLMNRGYTKELNSMQGIGYKELISYLNGEISFDAAVSLIKQSSRRYAKRQLTWFRRDERINWIKPEEASNIDFIF